MHDIGIRPFWQCDRAIERNRNIEYIDGTVAATAPAATMDRECWNLCTYLCCSCLYVRHVDTMRDPYILGGNNVSITFNTCTRTCASNADWQRWSRVATLFHAYLRLDFHRKFIDKIVDGWLFWLCAVNFRLMGKNGENVHPWKLVRTLEDAEIRNSFSWIYFSYNYSFRNLVQHACKRANVQETLNFDSSWRKETVWSF